jgi:hypothetical protein
MRQTFISRSAILIILISFLAGSSVQAASWWYRSNFKKGPITNNGAIANRQTEWSNNTFYGRQGVFVDDTSTSAQQTNAGKLRFTGNPNTGGTGRNGYWVGCNVWNTNNFTASVTNPFGWEIIRTKNLLDNNTGGGSSGNARLQCMDGIALFVDTGVKKTILASDHSMEWYTYPNYYDFEDHIGNWDTPVNSNRQYISCNDQVELDLHPWMIAASNECGVAYNLTNVMLWNYRMLNPPNASIATNTNRIGFRMVYDGTWLKRYVNPNPIGKRADLPNEWLYSGQSGPFSFNQNIRVAINQAMLYSGAMNIIGLWSNMLIRSAADQSRLSLGQSGLQVSSGPSDLRTVTLIFSNIILNQVNKTNAGINCFHLTKPSEFQWPSIFPLTNNDRVNYAIRVRDYYDNTTIQTLVTRAFTNMPGVAGFFGTPNKMMVRTNGNDIYLYLSSQITNMSTPANENIYVDMQFQVNNFSSAKFGALVKAEQFAGMSAIQQNRYSTCGWQQCTLTSGASNITVTRSPALAYSALSPASRSVYQGQGNYSFTYYISTSLITNRQDVLQVAIAIPAQFSNSQILFTNFSSVVLGAGSANYIKVTNGISGVTNAKVIFINYSLASSKISSPDGLDVLSFNVRDSFSRVTVGTGYWKAWVSGTTLDAVRNVVRSNVAYGIKTGIVLAKGAAQGYASIAPNSIFAGPSAFTFTYYLSTAGLADGLEDINKVIIKVPPQFTNYANITITNFSSVVLGTNQKNNFIYKTNFGGSTNKAIYVNYKKAGVSVASPNGLDVITFQVWNPLGNITTGTGTWKSWVDGGLGTFKQTLTNSSFKSQTVAISALGKAIGFAAISPNSVYKGQGNYSFTYYLSTGGVPSGRQPVMWAGIEVPAQFTNAQITNFSSVLLGTNGSKTHIKWTNFIPGKNTQKSIKISYTQGTNIVSPNGLDVITFNVIGNITTGTGQWRSWVDGISLVTTSSDTRTNGTYVSKRCVILPKSPAQANASIAPNSIFRGPSSFSFTYYVSTAGLAAGLEDINKVIIKVPSQFTNYANITITNFSSVVLGTNQKNNFIYKTNFGGSTNKAIYINYKKAGVSVASPNGLDVITFNVLNPLGNITTGTGTWKSWVDGGFGSFNKTLTNSSFKSQTVAISALGKAIGFAAISPNSVFKGQGNYSFTYYLSTGGVPSGRQPINWAGIEVPTQFTNAKITNFNSVLLGTNGSKTHIKWTNFIAGKNTQKSIKISYTQGTNVVSPNGLDVITFNVIGNITTGTGQWKSWVDGVSLVTTSSDTRTNGTYVSKRCIILPKSPAQAYASVAPNSIFRGPSSFSFTYYISTAGLAAGLEDINWALIKVPPQFTNYGANAITITNFSSVVLGTNQKNNYIYKTNAGGATNKAIKINYKKAGVSIASPNGLDVITFQVLNPLGNITTGTGTWKSWVDGGLGSFNKTLTNSSFKSQATVIHAQGAAQAYASISPHIVFQGPAQFDFTYYFSTTGITNGRQAITWAGIQIPATFTNLKFTNFNSVLLTNETTAFEITNAITGLPGKFIKINYNSSPIASPNGLDVISFRVLGSVTKGNARWQSYVDGGNGLSGSSLATSTNGTFPSQTLLVTGETPLVSGEISKPSASGDHVVLFNSVTFATLWYKLENTSLNVDNLIQEAVIILPPVFTNVLPLSSSIATNYIKKGRFPNQTVMTLFYDHAGLPIQYNHGVDTISFKVMHNINPGQSTNISLSAVINNSNGEGFMPASLAGKVNKVLIQNSQPIGSCSIEAVKGIVYTSDISNRFKYSIKNTAPEGDIYFAQILFPGNIWTNITSVTSTILGTLISPVGSNLSLNYSNIASRLTVNRQDDIYFTARDKYTGTIPFTNTVYSYVRNLGPTNRMTGNLATGTRTITFVPQAANVQSYVSNNNIKTSVTTCTLYYIFHNNGDPGNKLTDARVSLTNLTSGAVHIQSVTSPLGIWAPTTGSNFISVGYNLDGGQKDTLKIVMNVNVSIPDSFCDMIGYVTVNTSTLVPTTYPAGNTNRVYFRTPPPVGNGGIYPSVMFTVTGKTQVLQSTYSIFNNGDPGNVITNAAIYIPAILQGKVRATSNTWPGATIVTNGPARIVISFGGLNLGSHQSNNVSLFITNTLSTKTNLFWQLGVGNNDGKGLYTNTGTIPGKRKNSYVIKQPEAYISAPSFIQDASVTNLIIMQLDNNDANGLAIKQFRIKIPGTVYTVVTNSVNAPYGAGSTKVSMSNGYIWVDFSANYLNKGNQTYVSFNAVDSITKGTNTSLWNGDIQFFTNGAWYPTATNLGPQMIQIRTTPPSASAQLSRNYLYTTAMTDVFYVRLTNTGAPANYITRAKITVSPNLRIIASGVSNMITNAAHIGYYNFSGSGYQYVILDYYADNNHLNGGAADRIKLVLADTISNFSTASIAVSVLNSDPPVGGYFGVSGSTNINAVDPANMYISATPSPVDVTSYSNTYTIRLQNPGGDQPVQKAVILLPSIINHVGTVNSALGATTAISGTSSVTLKYGVPLTAGNFDLITLTLGDSRDYPGTNNVPFDCLVDDGTGYVDTTINLTRSISYFMPSVNADGNGLSGSVNISASTIVSSNIAYQIVNKGTNANRLFYAEIKLPKIFETCRVTNLTSLQTASSNLSWQLVGTNLVIKVAWEKQAPLAAQASDTINFRLAGYNIPVETLNQRINCWARNLPAPGITNQIDRNTLINIIDPNPFKANAFFFGGSTLYTLDSTANLTYRIENSSTKTQISSVELSFNYAGFSNLNIQSSLPTSSIITSASKIIVTYMGGAFSKAGGASSYDTLSISFAYHVTNTNSQAVSSLIHFNGGFDAQALVPSGKTNVLSIRKSWWGLLQGSLFPRSKPVNFELRQSGVRLNKDAFGNDMVYNPSSTNGTFKIDRIPAGTYDLYLKPDKLYQEGYYMYGVVIVSNHVTAVPLIYLLNAKMLADAANSIYCFDDTNRSSLVLPEGSLPYNTFLDIYVKPITSEEVTGISGNSSLKGVDVTGLSVYNFNLRNTTGETLRNVTLGKQATLTLAYDQSKGWDATKLAIYYWDPDFKKWIMIGGTPGSGVVTATVSVLHGTYAVLPATRTGTGPIKDVTVAPNPFTPFAASSSFNVAKILFSLDNTYTGIAVRIFNVKGELVKTFKDIKDGSMNVEVGWDGKDDGGYPVQAGVYIFQIKADKNVHSGTILLAK